MSLSALQKYIVTRLFQANKTTEKALFNEFYRGSEVDQKIAQQDIARSIERLIARDFVKAHGVKTAKKWYTTSVSLTAKGSKIARAILGSQQQLPLGKKRSK